MRRAERVHAGRITADTLPLRASQSDGLVRRPYPAPDHAASVTAAEPDGSNTTRYFTCVGRHGAQRTAKRGHTMSETGPPKRVFISHNYVDKKQVGDLLRFFAPSGGPVQAEPVTLDKDVSAGGDLAIEERIDELMRRCVGLIILVGGVSHNRRWSDYEIAEARRRGIPVTGVRHGEGMGGPPNEHRWLAFLDWDPARIAAHVAGWRRRPDLRWEILDDAPSGVHVLQRARVHGGWLVHSLVDDGAGITFVPDPDHEW